MTIDDLLQTLLQKLTSDLDGLAALFAPEAIVEFPYAGSVGLPDRVEGREAIQRHFEDVIKRVGFSSFRFSNQRSYPGAEGDSAWFEIHGTADLPGGKRYEQDYVIYLRRENGLVARYREYWNMVPIVALGVAS